MAKCPEEGMIRLILLQPVACGQKGICKEHERQAYLSLHGTVPGATGKLIWHTTWCLSGIGS